MRNLTLIVAFILSIWTNYLFAQEPSPQPVAEPQSTQSNEPAVAASARPSLLGGIKRCFQKMTQQEKQTSPWGMSYGVASPTQGPAPTQGPGTPWYGYGMGVPTYSYGWFGATYRPARVSHTGYYGDFYQWGYRRGF